MNDEDAVDRANAAWARAYPTLDTSPAQVLARVQRLAELIERAQTERLSRSMELPLTNRGDFDVLRTLRSSGPPYALTPRVIERGMLVSAAGLTGRLKRLEAAGWIRRTASEVDGRSVLVQLTESGLMALDRSLPGHYAFEASLLDAIDPAERAVVADVLRRLINSLEAAGRSD